MLPTMSISNPVPATAALPLNQSASDREAQPTPSQTNSAIGELPTLPPSIWTPTSSFAMSGDMALNMWIRRSEREVKAAASVLVPPDGVAFQLEAPTCQHAAVSLLQSMRYLLYAQSSPIMLDWFEGRLPRDVADYFSSAAIYTM
jgi:hypothetical protein